MNKYSQFVHYLFDLLPCPIFIYFIREEYKIIPWPIFNTIFDQNLLKPCFVSAIWEKQQNAWILYSSRYGDLL